MTARSTIVLGVLLVAGSFAVTKDLGYDDPAGTPVVEPHQADRDLRDGAWRRSAVTAQPEQIFQD